MIFQQKTVTACATSTTPILLDCCTVISAFQGKPGALEFKKKLSKRKDLTLLVPEVVISEVAKIARLSADAAEQAIMSFSLGNDDNIKRIVRLEDDQKTLADAVLLSLRYDYCHYPDSIYLILARNAGAVLVTYDRRLRDVASMEGIMACSPDNLPFY